MENVWNELDDGSQHGFGVASCTPYTDLLGCQMTEGQDEATPHCDVQVSNNDTTESPSTGKRPKKAKQGQVSKSTAIRSSSYTPKEDEVICSAYLNVSKDPVVSVNQPSKTYWERICDYYNENRGMYGQRTISSLQHRWGEISRDTCKFTAFYAEIERKNQSGKNEDDKIKDALQLYNGVLGHSFKFIHCWFILRHEQKWHEFVAEKKQHNKTRPEPSAEPVSPMAPATDTPQINAQNLVRPMGRDTAKRLRSANSSASSTGCLEVLQKIHSDRAKYEKRQEEHIKDESKEMVERYERKLRLQEESINFQDSMNFQKELLTKQVSIQEKMLALQEKERVDKVMMADLDKFPSWVRDYYVIEQKEIAARRLQAGQPSGEK